MRESVPGHRLWMHSVRSSEHATMGLRGFRGLRKICNTEGAEGAEDYEYTSAKLLRSLRSRCFLAAGIALWVCGCDKVTREVTTIARDSSGVRIVDVMV